MSLKLRGMDLATTVQVLRAGWQRESNPGYVFICIADHFEPEWRSASNALQDERVRRWVREYPLSVAGICDSRGQPPQHTFFYPVECYRAELLDQLARLCRAGLGEIEVHLHHENDTAERLRDFLLHSVSLLHDRHGLLRKSESGQVVYGFVHGNWALDNSHPQGHHCGVNNELNVLIETGCYADFTMPAAPASEQTRIINSIYYAIDDPLLPKSHDTGHPVAHGSERPDNGLLMIQGPLLYVQRRLWSKPRLENANIAGSQPPSISRLREWLRARVTVQGREDWAFVKLHTHGAQEDNAAVLLGPAMRQFHEGLHRASAAQGFQYFYVTGWEMAQLVHQAERGLSDPDFELLRRDFPAAK